MESKPTQGTDRQSLTPAIVRKLKASDDGKTRYVFDTDPKRLCVRITATGAKSYVFAAKLRGTPLRITIGATNIWNLDDAQREARRLQTIVDNGEDPRQIKAERIAKAEAKLIEAERADLPALVVWNAYINDRRGKWGAANLHDHMRFADVGGKPITRGRKNGRDTTEQGILYGVLSLPLAKIDSEVVRAWLRTEVARRPTMTALAYRLLRAFLNWCTERPEYKVLAKPDACASRIARDELPKKAAKDDCLQREQLPLWFEHVRKLQNPVHSAYLQGLLLTGARREELLGLKWGDVDFQWKSLTIRDKVEGQRVIPLTPYVALLLTALPRRNQWVFSSPAAKSGRLQEPRIAHNKSLVTAGLPALTLHGLRRSFGTLAEWVEVPAGVVAQIQGHKPSATVEKHYRVRPLDLLRMWHVRIEGWILEQAGIEQPKEDEKAGLKAVA